MSAAFSVDPKAKCLRTSLEVLESSCHSLGSREQQRCRWLHGFMLLGVHASSSLVFGTQVHSLSLHVSHFIRRTHASLVTTENAECVQCSEFMSFTWFEERHEGQTLVDDVVTKHVPPHIGLFYCFGGIVFMALVAQFTSGLVLA